MASWSTHELAVLRDAAHMGPAAASAAIWAACRTRRSPAACQRQASRMGVSTAVRRVCPVCGFTSRKASDFTDGDVCRRCNNRMLADIKRREVELIRSCAEGARRSDYERDLAEARRSYDMYRQQKSRLRDEYGEVAVAIYEKVSNDLSNGRSEQEKSYEDEMQGTLF